MRASARDRTRRRLLISGDAIAFVAAFAITGFATPLVRSGYEVVVALVLWTLLNKLLGLHDRDTSAIDKSTIHELPAIAESVVIGAVLIFLLAPALGLDVHRHQALEFVAVAVLSMAVLRWRVRRAALRWYGPERALIVGSGSVAKLVTRKLRAHPSYGVEVVGRIDAPHPDGDDGGGPSLLGDTSRLKELYEELSIERLIVAFSPLGHEDLLDTIRASRVLGVKLTIVPRLFEAVGRSAMVDEIEGMSVLALCPLPRARSALALKRALDLICAAIGLLLLAPLFALIALAIKLGSRGPVFFAQERIGRGNRPFRIYKFRTMVDGADQAKGDLVQRNEAVYPMFKIADDPRTTRVGRLLRRGFLDELPQLWNVLRGEMSLVGPRPLVPSEDAHVLGWHRARLELTPGLTGPWQVLGRHSIPFDEMVRLDYLYVDDWSLWNDIKLVIRTAPIVLGGNGQ